MYIRRLRLHYNLTLNKALLILKSFRFVIYKYLEKSLFSILLKISVYHLNSNSKPSFNLLRLLKCVYSIKVYLNYFFAQKSFPIRVSPIY